MADFNEMLKKRVVYEIPGMEQIRRIENGVYKTVDGVELLLDVYYPVDLQEGEQRLAVLFYTVWVLLSLYNISKIVGNTSRGDS